MHWIAKIRIGIVLLVLLVPFIVYLMYAAGEGYKVPEDVRKEIERLRSPIASVRVDAARCLGAMGEKARPAVPFLIKLLRDVGKTSNSIGDSTGVVIVFSNPREAAAQALAQIKDPRAIGPLIDVVDLDFTRYGYGAARRALKEMTGYDFRDNKKKWQEWWEKNKERFEKGK